MKGFVVIIFLSLSSWTWSNLPNDAIVISGQPGPMLNKKHFLENGLDRSLKLRNAFQRDACSEQVVWVIYNSGDPDKGGYPDSILQFYLAQAASENIEAVVVNSGNDLIELINERADTSITDAKFSKLHYYGHATLGNLEVGYINGKFWNKLFSDRFDIRKLEPTIFSDSALVDVVGGCRTALPPNYFRNKSVAEQFQPLINGKILASDVRVYYPGGPVSDKTLVKKNNGNIIEFQGTRD
jgi:hypothetical protein